MASRAEDLFREIELLSEPERTAHVEAWLPKGHTENEYLDFKTGKGDDQPKSWSKALSAFANTEGGVLVWGVDARKPSKPDSLGRRLDQVVGLTPVDDPASLVQLLKDHLRDATIEPVRGVEYLAVPAGPSHGPGKGYVICLVPEGVNKPYRSLLEQKENYWQRIGDQMLVIPHNMLRTMFYPRVQARFDLIALESTQQWVNVGLRNTGNATADGLFVQAFTKSKQLSIKFLNPHWDRVGSGTSVHSGQANRPLHPNQSLEMLQFGYTGEPRPQPVKFSVSIAVFVRDQPPVFFRQHLEERTEQLRSLGEAERLEQLEIPM